ncbi:nuclear transport factor 2 family protein [Necropsobacter massiliensis]|uniref:nuclear transport factor 2 family protein n=1 Tax=Necropsobacter massiliensis TaxID=1400001 RepID=UPI000595AA4F|nr:nuclear transport factor 2 family protein [Necropsobacter massiliensis]
MIKQTRNKLKQTFQQFLTLWAKGLPTDILAENVQLHSFSGHFCGRDEVLGVLEKGRGDFQLKIESTNLYVAGSGDSAVVSGYVYGALENVQRRFTFHGVTVLNMRFIEHEWRVEQIRTTHAIDGAIAPGHWKTVHLVHQGWQPNEPTLPIVSELDSPWALYPQNEFAPIQAQEQVEELYAQYAWGLDFGDFALLADVFADNVKSDLTPMGKQQGKRDVYGQLRAFRFAASYLYHATRPLETRFEGDTAADMLLGRVISEQTHTETGEELYAAYYDNRLEKQADGKWRFTRFEYHPKWFTHSP